MNARVEHLKKKKEMLHALEKGKFFSSLLRNDEMREKWMPDREIIFNSRKRLFETNVKKKKREEKRKIRYNSLSVREKRLPDDCLSRKILVIFVGEKKKKKIRN